MTDPAPIPISSHLPAQNSVHPQPPEGALAGAEVGKPALRRSGSGALLVASGILLSRLMGLVRERVFAHYLGNSVAAAAFKAAQKIPNLLQNLFGEGVLSASFIPVYTQLLTQKKEEDADRVAGAVLGVLSLLTSVLVALGVWATPLLIDLIAPGFHGEARELCVRLVRILFPATGLLVLSAWCLGILNSHRRFFLSYAAPVVLNLTLNSALVFFGQRRDADSLVVAVAWAMVVGSGLQFFSQLPTVLRLLGGFHPSLRVSHAEVRAVLHNFLPAVMGRGVVQISAYVDLLIASLAGPRAVSALSYAQILYLLPVSLFGMSISAAELPEMAAESTSPLLSVKLRARIESALGRMAFFVVPSVAALAFLGDVVGATVFQTGRFTGQDSRYLWYILAGSSVGLLANTQGRLYASSFYALRDTRTPFFIALLRMGLAGILGYLGAVVVPERLGWPPYLGAVALTAASGLASWVEFLLLRRKLSDRLGPVRLSPRLLAKLWVAALLAAGVGLAIKGLFVRLVGPSPSALSEVAGAILPAPAANPLLVGAAVLAPFGLIYFAVTAVMGIPQAEAIFRRLGLLRLRGK